MATAKKAGKKTSVKRVYKPKKAKPASFKIQKETVPFMSFKITEQTVYWLVVVLLIFLLGIWVLRIQLDLSELLDQIEYTL
ncbi:MAG: hypothetical protein WBI29_01305 [Candidatus Saccharimonadales bacterium]